MRPAPASPGPQSPPQEDSGGPLLHLETTLGAIVVGGRGIDRHSGDALLTIDLGGDDVWTNNAGSNFGIKGAAALALDVDGNDRYQSVRPHAQGAGFAGVGLLLDAGSGADGYFAGVHAQGAGFYGVGILWDEGGDDAYQAEGFAQGAGTFGTGLLIDGGGNDEAIVRGRGQGFGSTYGLGALLDLGGNDQRRLGLPGRDRDDPHGGIGQGGRLGYAALPVARRRRAARRSRPALRSRGFGYLLRPRPVPGLGVVPGARDAPGAQRRRPLPRRRTVPRGRARTSPLDCSSTPPGATHTPECSPSKVRPTIAPLGCCGTAGSDGDGYSVGPGSGQQGLGRDGQGFARRARALGILVDDGGDDAYTADRDAMGEALVPARPDVPPHGLFFDLGGTDTYEKAARRPGNNPADGAAWSSEDLASGIDTTADYVGFPTTGIPNSFASVGPEVPVVVPAPAGVTAASAAYAQAEAALRAIISDGESPEPTEEPIVSTDVRVAAIAREGRPPRR